MNWTSRVAWSFIALLMTARMAPADAAEDCSSDLALSKKPPVHRAVTFDDLMGLRDIGPGSPDRARKLFAISPDGETVAFQLHRADAVKNGYCVGLAIFRLSSPQQARILDVGGELIMDSNAIYGWAALPLGAPMPITPRWSPDGQWIAYLKRVHGSTQVWIVDVRKGVSRQITHADVDVDDFRISPDGRTLIYAARPGLAEIETAIDQEGLRGWRYDDRAFPIRSGRPQTPDAARVYHAVEIAADGRIRRATAAEVAEFVQSNGATVSHKIRVQSTNMETAWIEPTKREIVPADYQLVVETPDKGYLRCPVHICLVDQTSLAWWGSKGDRLRFSHREGWANSVTAIYEWIPGKGRPKRIYQTTDLLIGCEPTRGNLICLRERSREPRHFAKLLLDEGKVVKLFDPNPEFSTLILGHAERLNWRDGFGVAFYGDLVYPTTYKKGQPYPLVVVQYRTKGFLRGGIGDEVPVQVFANQGYFVLVVDNLTYEDIIGRQESAAARTTAFNRDFAGRRHILSAIETMIGSLIAKGMVDKRRVGITGLSDGSTTVQFAAINSDLFSAGSVSGGCWSPVQDAILGPVISRQYHRIGWPLLAEKNNEFWSNISLMDRIRPAKFPLLFQMADNEYLSVNFCHTALRQMGIPSDLYIFPQEEHIKWQPAHRMAVYRRNLAWFDFWLKGKMPIDALERAEAERWSKMRSSSIGVAAQPSAP